MAFSTATLTHAFQNADGSAATGIVTFTLTKRITNDTTTVLPATIPSNLNPSGQLSQVLTANNDAGTVPTDSQWRVDIRVAGSQELTYYIIVPTGGGTVDLGTLLPQDTTGG